jgi:superfamily I DNA and RNA helicase
MLLRICFPRSGIVGEYMRIGSLTAAYLTVLLARARSRNPRDVCALIYFSKILKTTIERCLHKTFFHKNRNYGKRETNKVYTVMKGIGKSAPHAFRVQFFSDTTSGSTLDV